MSTAYNYVVKCFLNGLDIEPLYLMRTGAWSKKLSGAKVFKTKKSAESACTNLNQNVWITWRKITNSIKTLSLRNPSFENLEFKAQAICMFEVPDTEFKKVVI